MSILALIKIISLMVIPCLAMKLENHAKIFSWTGSVINCFLLGIILGHLPGVKENTQLSMEISEYSVLLGLPLLLLSTDFKSWLKLAPSTLISFGLLIIIVCFFSFLMGAIFKEKSDELWIISGMLTGVYIGGSANLIAIGKALNIRPETFLLVNAAELMVGGIYFFIAVGFLPKFCAKWMIPFATPKDLSASDHEYELIQKNWKSFSFQKQLQHFFVHLSATLIIVGISVGLSFLLWSKLEPVTILLSLSLIAILASLNHKVRNFPGTTQTGHYLLLIFCCAIGSLANLKQLHAETLFYFFFCWIILIPSVVVHLFLCFLLKIDRDTALVTSMAGIFGPAFIPALSDRLNNRWILVSGITTGLVGLSLGNFFGLLISYLLKP